MAPFGASHMRHVNTRSSASAASDYTARAAAQFLARSHFPSAFKFGAGSSNYQVEGAPFDGGRGMSTWDSFSHFPGNISDGSTADKACDHYHQFEADVQLMVELGIDVYRFSLSWPRILPAGTGEINQKGVSFYNKVINLVLHNGIEPYVTLFHWDMPQALENDIDIKGWRTREIVKYFTNYAETCFKLFGDRVKNWVTVNEIHTLIFHGYGTGLLPPGRSSSICGTVKKSYVGDSSTEPYQCAHHVLLSHAAAVKVYKKKYQAEQRGRIGMTVISRWFEPYSATNEDVDAAQRSMEFELGWVLDPILLGDYPDSMKAGAGDRLPSFSQEEKADLMGSLDFIGYNYYTACYSKSAAQVESSKRWFVTDRLADDSYKAADGLWIGEPYGPASGTQWLFHCPWGLPNVLQWMEDRYSKEQFRKTPILITENGCMDMAVDISLEEALNDYWRIRYMSDSLSCLATAIRKNQYNVEAYFVWSLLDSFEWNSGLATRFGLHYVDYENDQKRYPKASSLWYRRFLKGEHQTAALTLTKKRHKLIINHLRIKWPCHVLQSLLDLFLNCFLSAR